MEATTILTRGGLQAGRNRCAHPSLTADDQAYAPSAELARLHIYSAVTHLLQHPPAQGKYALDRLIQDVESDYFPTDSKTAKVSFAAGPLRRPRESLVRNAVLVFVKVLLKEKPDYKRRMRINAALAAIRELHPAPFSATLTDRLSALFRGLPDPLLSSATYFLRDIGDTWPYLDPDIHLRIQNYVIELPEVDLDDLEFLLKYQPLQKQARTRVQKITRKDIANISFFDMPTEVADQFITIFLTSTSFDDANACAKQMMLYSTDFTKDHITRLLASSSKNPQVRGCFQLGALIAKLRGRKRIPEKEFEELLVENDLEEFSPVA